MTTLLDTVMLISERVKEVADHHGLAFYYIVQDGCGMIHLTSNMHGLKFDDFTDEWTTHSYYELHPVGYEDLADDYNVSIITSEEFYAKLKKRASMKNAKSTNPETIEKETGEMTNREMSQQEMTQQEMTPQEIRNRVLVINSTIPKLISEREELIAELNRQGFSLIEEMQQHTLQEDGVINLEGMSDSEKFSLITQRTKFECIETHRDSFQTNFQKGEIYTVCRIDIADGSVGIEKEDGDYEWFWKHYDNDTRLLFKYFKIVSFD